MAKKPATKTKLDDEILLEIAAPIATVTLNRPDDMNRMSPAGIERLGAIVESLAGRDDVHAVLVTGAGSKFFSAGLLNPEIRAAMTKDQVVAFVLRANRVFDALEALPQVTICAINGTILAGACELALACDIRLVSSAAKMAMPEARWGGFPGAGGPVRLPMVVGHGHALRLIGSGREIDASEMERIGLVQSIHAPRSLRTEALKLAQEIGSNGPLATRGAKRIVRQREEPGFHAARELSDALRKALEWSDDVDEGIAAHRENRAPKFKGR